MCLQGGIHRGVLVGSQMGQEDSHVEELEDSHVGELEGSHVEELEGSHVVLEDSLVHTHVVLLEDSLENAHIHSYDLSR